MRDLSPEVLALFCSHMDDATALGTFAACCTWLRDALCHPDFFGARCQLRREASPRSLIGCAFVPPPGNVPKRLRPFFEQSLDFSLGSEPKGVTMITQITLRFAAEDKLFYSDLPKEVATGVFRYDAGPWPAAFALQVAAAEEDEAGAAAERPSRRARQRRTRGKAATRPRIRMTTAGAASEYPSDWVPSGHGEKRKQGRGSSAPGRQKWPRGHRTATLGVGQ